jgi:hypothetical protein
MTFFRQLRKSRNSGSNSPRSLPPPLCPANNKTLHVVPRSDVKCSLCLTSYHADTQQALQTSTSDEAEWSATHCLRFTQEKQPLVSSGREDGWALRSRVHILAKIKLHTLSKVLPARSQSYSSSPCR